MIPTCAFGLWPWECQSASHAFPIHTALGLTPTPYGGVPPERRYCVPARGHQRIEDRGDGSEEL